MQIMQIEDSYVAKNGGTPNDHIFLIQNFKDNKEGLLYFFNYLEDSIKPKFPFSKKDFSSFPVFIFNKNDISFDDGTYERKGESISVLFDPPPFYLFYSIHFNTNKLIKKQTYTIQKQGNFIDIIMEYKELNINILTQFMTAVQECRKKNKTWRESTFSLIRKNNNKKEAAITYHKIGETYCFDLKIIEN